MPSYRYRRRGGVRGKRRSTALLAGYRAVAAIPESAEVSRLPGTEFLPLSSRPMTQVSDLPGAGEIAVYLLLPIYAARQATAYHFHYRAVRFD